ncbi:MAG: phosphoglycerate mutase [Candidatus Nealsonbacteria bacterium CG10_big_fil_rev_8_21_14_0_10_36_24]|uniref:phosphoglycerate mutase (2,3-diphosphoglycerate-dependent) n=2 Tax=Candidatus Nealsoniibacteriota TaxID=1817911 RepID=A0A2H0YNT2_9BACT|nr:MAG: phosphoglycerate mutase [Candidatus Nealsonbacteria bacterium CG10_big_fil_rev_8_21_14_0_10_36_24]PIS40155.1 MAG: phosphoglycerate mutase [Candidatus Nealsonbacteria bacterium CG08_land_8_20_14_0_20_36_22]
MAKLFLLRHLKSQWNEEENRFTGWVDAPLAEGQEEEAKILAQKIFQNKIDVIYCSRLFRNMDTIAEVLEHNKKYPIFIHLDKGKMKEWGHFKDLSENDLPVYVSEKLNERYYGKLQGSYKEEAIKAYGAEKVHFWRRSYNIAPPGGESLKDVYKRTTLFFKKYIKKDLKKGKNVLIIASHNSLRALIKYLEKISDSDIINVEVDYGQLIKYEFNKSLTIVKK